MGHELGRPPYIMDIVQQMMQSNDTMTLNLNKDFEELMDKVQQTGGMDRQQQQGSGQKKKTTTTCNREDLRSSGWKVW